MARRSWNKRGLGDVDLNDYSGYACRHTGFLPLHCVVACRMPSMVNFLLELHEQLTQEHEELLLAEQPVAEQGGHGGKRAPRAAQQHQVEPADGRDAREQRVEQLADGRVRNRLVFKIDVGTFGPDAEATARATAQARAAQARK